MLSWIAENRALFIVGLFLFFSFLESWWPTREQTLSIVSRWFTNLTLFAIMTPLSMILHLLPTTLFAFWMSDTELGLFNNVDAPLIVVAMTGLVAFDLANYAMHRAMHQYAWLWNLHKIHHTDIDVDITTSFRFHPGEGILAVVVHLLIVLALGLPPEAVVLHWVVVNVFNLFGHANLRLPTRIDRLLQHGVVTASMHRLHHTTDYDDGNRNFGSILAIWDHMFGTFRGTSSEAQRDADYGLPEYRDGSALGLMRLLLMPFDRETEIVSAPAEKTTSP